MKRNLWIALILLTLAACSSPGPTAAPATRLEPITLSGTGDDVIEIAQYSAYSKAKLTHTGERNFIVRPLNADGTDRRSLVNEIGAYEGTVPWDKAGHSLSIRADGDWTITLSQ